MHLLLWSGFSPGKELRSLKLCSETNRMTEGTKHKFSCLRFSSVQSLSHLQLLWPPRTAARQASLSITNSQSLLKLMSIESVMPSNHFIFCHPLLLLPSIFSSFRVFSSESVLWHQVAKVLEFQLQHQSFQWISRTYFLSDWLVWSPCSPRNSQESSPTQYSGFTM